MCRSVSLAKYGANRRAYRDFVAFGSGVHEDASFRSVDFQHCFTGFDVADQLVFLDVSPGRHFPREDLRAVIVDRTA